MKVAVIGATGNAGSRVVNELVSRGHQVTAVVRDTSRVTLSDQVSAAQTDGTRESLAAAVKGHDAVVSSVKFIDLNPDVLVPAVLDSAVARYVVVGGAGTLIGPSGVREFDDPNFPAPARLNSVRGGYLLELLQKTQGLDWTYISPSRFFVAGDRTGKFRYGTDTLLFGEDGESRISFEDFALALVDELEKPQYIRQRFTVGY